MWTFPTTLLKCNLNACVLLDTQNQFCRCSESSTPYTQTQIRHAPIRHFLYGNSIWTLTMTMTLHGFRRHHNKCWLVALFRCKHLGKPRAWKADDSLAFRLNEHSIDYQILFYSLIFKWPNYWVSIWTFKWQKINDFDKKNYWDTKIVTFYIIWLVERIIENQLAFFDFVDSGLSVAQMH